MRVPKPLTDPWLITTEGMRRVVDVWALARAGGEVFGSLEKARAEWKARPVLAEPGDPVEGTGGTLRIVDIGGVAIGVLSIQGTLFRHANLITEFSGGASDDSLWAGLEAALADPTVKAILLRIDSPGGEANGTAELGDRLFKARSEKPLWSYIEGLGCSKALWYAVQASRVVANRAAMVGSIGARIEVLDTAEAEEKAGLKFHDLTSDGAPGKRNRPVDDEVIARLKVKLNDLETEFVKSVAQGRGVSEAKVYDDFGQGDYMIAGKALDVGLIDEIGDFNGTLASLAEAAGAAAQVPSAAPAASAKSSPAPRASARPRKGPTMKIEAEEPEKKPDAESDEPAMEKVECEECGGSGKVDGAECEKCGGTGKVDAEADAEAEEKAEGDDKGEGEHHEPDGDEEEDAKARASMAALAGLKPTASLKQIAAAVKAKTVPLTAVAKLREEHAAMSSRIGALEADKHKAAAQAFVTKAIADGRTTEEKRPHLEAEYAEAERAKAGSGPKALEPQLFAKGTFTVGRRYTFHSKPINKGDEPPVNLAQDEPGEIRARFAAKIDEIMKKDKVDFREATARVKTADPELYAAFAAINRAA